VPLAALPHPGPAATAAYSAVPDAGLGTAHCRTHVTQYLDVDTE